MDKKKLFKYCFGRSSGNIPENAVISAFVRPEKFREQCSPPVENFKGMMYSGIVSGEGAGFSAIHCGMGDRLLGDAVIMLADAGVKRILFLGACGGLGDVSVGGILIPGGAFNGEGFSRYYTDGFDMASLFAEDRMEKPDEDLAGKISGYLGEQIKGGVKAGNIFTIGSLLAETPGNVSILEEKGFSGIDMELSAVYRAGRVSGARVAAALIISDIPGREPLWKYPWRSGGNDFKDNLEKITGLIAGFFDAITV